MIRTMSAQVSKHARKRTKQRAGLGKRAAVRNAQKAFDLGVKHSETNGRLLTDGKPLMVSMKKIQLVRHKGGWVRLPHAAAEAKK